MEQIVITEIPYQVNKAQMVEKIADWLHKNSVQTVMGPKSWDAKGDLKAADFVVYKWSADGKYKQVQ